MRTGQDRIGHRKKEGRLERIEERRRQVRREEITSFHVRVRVRTRRL